MTTISIITICFNNLEEVVATCHSVDRQNVLPFEHLIINGSTNKETENYFSKNSQPPFRKIINERDKGIADAFNKGIKMASGDVLVMLNSGDCLYDENTLQTVSEKFAEDESLMWLHGKYRMNRSGMWVTLGKPFEREKFYRGMRSLSHQTMYIKKQLHERFGLYDPSYKIALDFDFLGRIRNEKFTFIPQILAIAVPGGISSAQYDLSLKESTIVVRKYLGSTWKNKLWNLRLKTLKTIQNIPILGKTLYRIKAALGLANV